MSRNYLGPMVHMEHGHYRDQKIPAGDQGITKLCAKTGTTKDCSSERRGPSVYRQEVLNHSSYCVIIAKA